MKKKKKGYTCKICGEIYPNPISVRRHRAQDHQPKVVFQPQSVEELHQEFDQLRNKIHTMVMYERSMAEGLQEQIAEHETKAEKLSTLLTQVNEYAKIAA